jgi:Met-10+ like-protein
VRCVSLNPWHSAWNHGDDQTKPGINAETIVMHDKFRVRGNSPSAVITRDNVKFMNVSTGYRQIFEVREYRFDDIRKDDIVIDIGANVGAFCIRAARYSKNVYAVEPLTGDLLRENIRLNEAPVKVMEYALGNGRQARIVWDCRLNIVQTVSLRDIITKAGGCDFLKCDCEGAEWLIDPNDLFGIRRLEMELHLPPIGGTPNPALLDFISRNYSFCIDHVPGHGPLGCMGYLHATQSY